jgi:NIPSNAP
VPTSEMSSPIVELRQYTLHPGKRDVLIDLFDREFVESQEAVGAAVIGQFRDVDDPDRFVWLRGFQNMTTRAQSLQAFYGGPVWKEHREAANATMIDSDNVLLLRPARLGTGFSADVESRPPRGAPGPGAGCVIATIYSLRAGDQNAMLDYFDRTLAPALTDSGAAILGMFVTEANPNTFPALPVRENENVLIWFAGLGDSSAELDLSDADAPGITVSPQRLRLIPTARSLLTGRSRACATTLEARQRHAQGVRRVRGRDLI